ncbi:MAG: alpha/beta hydrolase [Cellulosilyticaceae bacterium]
MALNPIIATALKALSSIDNKLEKTYKKERLWDDLTHPNLLHPFFKSYDRTIKRGNYDIPIRVFHPNEEGKHRILLFFHGGGFVKGNIEKYTNVCAYMANKTNSIVISVDYRLAPEYPFPKGIDDCYEVAKTVIRYPDIVKDSNGEVVLIGDSAGATMAAAVSLKARDLDAFKVSAQILLYPMTHNIHDATSPYKSVVENGKDYLLTSKRIREFMRMYIEDKKDYTNPYYAPLMTKSYSNQPDTLIITAEYDPLRDEGEEYGKRLKDAGNYVEVYRIKDIVHGFIALPPIADSVIQTYNYINKFLVKERNAK